MKNDALDNMSSVERRAERNFTLSLLVMSGIRCTLAYIVLPFVLPLIGISGRVALPIDIALVVVAIAALSYNIRRFWQINYSWKIPYTLVGAVALMIYAVFIAQDIHMLLTAS